MTILTTRILYFFFFVSLASTIVLSYTLFGGAKWFNEPRKTGLEDIPEAKYLISSSGQPFTNRVEGYAKTADSRTAEITGIVKEYNQRDGGYLVTLIVSDQKDPKVVTIDFGSDSSQVSTHLPKNGVMKKTRRWSFKKVTEIKDKFEVGGQIVVVVYTYLSPGIECASEDCDRIKNDLTKYDRGVAALDYLVWGILADDRTGPQVDSEITVGAVSRLIIAE